ncbi:MAG: nicotinate phosphoribosyltransferase, partial [Parachlamydiaceae bacterium]
MTDLYQLTMAYASFKNGDLDKEAVFHLFFRKKPFNGGFTVAAGLEAAITFIERFKIDDSDIAYLRTLKTSNNTQLFDDAFLKYLSEFKLNVSVDAVPEGTVVFPFEPLLRIQGPMIACQLLESPLLNLINFPTLIATKAARLRI